MTNALKKKHLINAPKTLDVIIVCRTSTDYNLYQILLDRCHCNKHEKSNGIHNLHEITNSISNPDFELEIELSYDYNTGEITEPSTSSSDTRQLEDY